MGVSFKSRLFRSRLQYIFDDVQKSDLQISQICPILTRLTHFRPKTAIAVSEEIVKRQTGSRGVISRKIFVTKLSQKRAPTHNKEKKAKLWPLFYPSICVLTYISKKIIYVESRGEQMERIQYISLYLVDSHPAV